MLFNRFAAEDADSQGRDEYFMDIDRMVNEGLGGGRVTTNNGAIYETTTDTMDEPESCDGDDGDKEEP